MTFFVLLTSFDVCSTFGAVLNNASLMRPLTFCTHDSKAFARARGRQFEQRL